MQRIPYWKYEGAGNDFVALDARDGTLAPETAFIREACDRRLGIGADGVLVLEPAKDPGIHFRMVYYNADGSRGEMCGNGARCIAAFAVLRGAAPASMRFLTDAGTYSAQVREDAISVSFPDIRERVVEKRAITEGRAWEGDYLPVGVPHFVTWVEDLDRVDVARTGRALGHECQLRPGSRAREPAPAHLRTRGRGGNPRLRNRFRRHRPHPCDPAGSHGAPADLPVDGQWPASGRLLRSGQLRRDRCQPAGPRPPRT